MCLGINVLLLVLLSVSVQLVDCNCGYFNDYAITNNYAMNYDWFCGADRNTVGNIISKLLKNLDIWFEIF